MSIFFQTIKPNYMQVKTRIIVGVSISNTFITNMGIEIPVDLSIKEGDLIAGLYGIIEPVKQATWRISPNEVCKMVSINVTFPEDASKYTVKAQLIQSGWNEVTNEWVCGL